MAVATAKPLIKRSNLEKLKDLDLENSSWAKSLFKRMSFVKEAAATGRPDISEGTEKEAEFLFLHQIVDLLKENNIPPSLIMNFDKQTSLKYAPVTSQTIAEKGSKHIEISGMTHRKSLTATLGMTFFNCFLPIQLIYRGKTAQDIPRTKFPESFSFSVNVKHFSNTNESIKLIHKIIFPCFERERRRLDSEGQPALLIIDVFNGQMIQPVFDLLKENVIFLVPVPANMMHIFQPLDLTVNRLAQSFFKQKFTEWYSNEIKLQLEAGTKLDEAEVELTLSTLKQLHSTWIIEFYNKMISDEGKPIIQNDW